MQNIFSHNLFAKTSWVFNLYLHKDYNFFIQNNSANHRNILSECNLFSMGVLFNTINFGINTIFICAFLLIYNFKILLLVFYICFFGGILFKKNAENLRLWGKKRQHHSAIA